MVAPARWWLVLSLLVAATALAGPKKKAPKVKPPPKAVTELEVRLVLDGAQERVGACVLDDAGDGLLDQRVLVKVTLDSVGSVMEAAVTLAPETALAAKTRACIEAVVREQKFPRSGAPMVIVEREWTFRTE